MKHLLSIDDLTKEEIDRIINRKHLTKVPKIIGTLFFEPSTRTKLSFHTAAYKIGGNVIDLPENSSQKKGESEEDTVKTMSLYANILVIRHPDAGRVAELANYSNVPVINAGDGNNEHPTQALIDLATINQYQCRDTKDITILLTGDLYYSRTINSLLKILSKSDYKIKYLLTDKVKTPPDNVTYIKPTEIKYYIEKVDVLYMTRPQKERWERERFELQDFVLTNELANRMKVRSMILHPFPRNNEIAPEVDKNIRSVYFQQMKNGVDIRAALINHLH